VHTGKERELSQELWEQAKDGQLEFGARCCEKCFKDESQIHTIDAVQMRFCKGCHYEFRMWRNFLAAHSLVLRRSTKQFNDHGTGESAEMGPADPEREKIEGVDKGGGRERQEATKTPPYFDASR